MNADRFSQASYRCRLDWGRGGARRAAERGDILVVVDTLSFSSATVTAIHYGGQIAPCSEQDDLAVFAQRIGAETAVGRRQVPQHGRFSLSPLTYIGIAPGTRVALRSPNGATCSRYAHQVPFMFTAALLNAQAVADTITQLLATTALSVTVLAAGERRQPDEDGVLRVAIEDYLGAGAILSYLRETKSPEALVCETAFAGSREMLSELLWECESGHELRAMGFPEDVRHAAQLNLYHAVPVMRGDHFERFDGGS
ncbi:MAG: hypothetical protein KatS3mg057_2464 [Herpetosiphonaceae bacterium]|nr:MAG: hypothetical protein KatS3mg057_2464 [Herpetosiphonaceae bacterium]